VTGETQVTKQRLAYGFTLIELLVVMAIIGTLLSIAAPRYFKHVERAKETTLRASLATMRDAIDKYHADTDRFPETLDELISRHYLKAVPLDPVTNRSDTWVTEPPADAQTGVFEVRSGAEGVSVDGTSFSEF